VGAQSLGQGIASFVFIGSAAVHILEARAQLQADYLDTIQASRIENDFLLGRARVAAARIAGLLGRARIAAALLLCHFVLPAASVTASRRELQQIFCPQPR